MNSLELQDDLMPLPVGVARSDMDVQGMRTRVYTAGTADKPPLVLLHGAGVDSALVSYGAVLADLGRDYFVVAPDLPGYGDSNYPEADQSVPWYACWVLDLLSTVDLESPAVVGLSLGGWIGLTMALDHPSSLRGLVAVNPGGISRTFRFMRTARWMANRPALNRRVLRVTTGSRRVARWGLAYNGVRNHEALTTELIDAVIFNARRPRAGDAFAGTQRWAFNGDEQALSLVPRLPQVTVPTLVLAGEKDRLVPVEDSRAAAAAIPGASCEVVPDCGHWLVRDRPDAFLTAVQSFMAGLPRSD